MTKNTRRRRLGSVRKLSSGRWLATIERGTKADGSRRIMSRTFDTRADADAWLVAISVHLDERPDMMAGVTLNSWWSIYVRTKGARLTKGTMRMYESLMKNVWLPRLGETDISAISCAMIQPVLLSLSRAKAEHARRVISSVLTHAVNEGVLAANPMHGTRFEMPHDTGAAYENEDMWDEDPFGVIEGTRDIWDAQTVVRALPLMRGLRLEPVWLAMVGGGLRMQEAFALRKMDVRRSSISGDEDGAPVMATQLAVHHAESIDEGRKRTKTARSVRIVTMLEPFGERYWELVCAKGGPRDSVCDVPRSNAGRMWRGYFESTNPKTAKHRPKRSEFRGDRGALVDSGLPYVALTKMRRSHESMMQQAKVLDSINASMHGHSQKVAYEHYQRADETQAVLEAQRTLRLVV